MELGSLLARRFERRLAVERSLEEIAILVLWTMVGRNPCRESSDAAVTGRVVPCHDHGRRLGSCIVSCRVRVSSCLMSCVVRVSSL